MVFNFLTGNGNYHLKNISLLETPDGDMMLSPAYDLMNTRLHLKDNLLALNLFEEMEQSSLPLGEAYPYTSRDFIEFGRWLGIREGLITKIIATYNGLEYQVLTMIDKSFLSLEAMELYKRIVVENYTLFRKVIVKH